MSQRVVFIKVIFAKNLHFAVADEAIVLPIYP